MDAVQVAKFNEVVNAVRTLIDFKRSWVVGQLTFPDDFNYVTEKVLFDSGVDPQSSTDIMCDLALMLRDGELKLPKPKGELNTVTIFVLCRVETTGYDDEDAWYEVDEAHVMGMEVSEVIPF